MKLNIRSPQDLGAGLIFGLSGGIGVFIGQSYTIGSAARMGPGYFPVMLGGMLILISLVLIVRSIKINGPPIDRPAWLANATIIVSILVFGMLIERVGLVATVIATIVLSSLAYGEARWREFLPLAIFMVFLTVGIVVFVLKQPLSLWGTWWMY